jgi:hypothetical protein
MCVYIFLNVNHHFSLFQNFWLTVRNKMEWLLNGPLPVASLCKMVADYVPKFTGKSSNKPTKQEVEVLVKVSDTLVAYTIPYGNHIYLWDITTDACALVARVDGLYDYVWTLLATPQRDIVLGTQDRFYIVNPQSIQTGVPVESVVCLKNVKSVVPKYGGLKKCITLTNGVLVAISDHYPRMMFLDVYNDTECNVKLQHEIRCLVALPDNQLASGDQKGRVHIWDQTGVCVRQLLTCSSAINALAWNADMLAVCTYTHIEWYRGSRKFKSVAYERATYYPCAGLVEKFFVMLEDYTTLLAEEHRILVWDDIGNKAIMQMREPVIDFGHCRIVGALPDNGLLVVE